MRRLKLWLLGVTTIFNLLLWLLIGNHYQLKGFLLGYSNTAWVGSIALVLLAYLTASVTQTLPPKPKQALNWHSLWRARLLWVLLKLGAWFLAALLVCFCLTVLGLLPWGGIGYLFAVLPAYVGSVLLFQTVALVLHEATLPKLATRLATTLAVVSVGFAFAWVSAWGFFFVEGYAPSCSQSFVSPSGQHTLVLETRDDPLDGDSAGHVYVESRWWRRALPDPLGVNACTDASLRVQWRADEKQVNWQNLNGQGYWQW